MLSFPSPSTHLQHLDYQHSQSTSLKSTCQRSLLATHHTYLWRGEDGYDYPMGQIQTLGKVSKEALEGNAEAYAPLTPEQVATHSIEWWLTVEDLPDPKPLSLMPCGWQSI